MSEDTVPVPPPPVKHDTKIVKGIVGTLLAVSDNADTAMTVLTALGTVSGGAAPVVGLVLKYGLGGLAKFLQNVTTPEFTEDEVAAHLGQMRTVTPQDAATFLG